MLEGDPPEPGPDAEPEPVDDALEGSISRVTEALSALLGPAAVGDDMFSAPPRREAGTAAAAAAAAAERSPWEERDRLIAEADQRAAAMAELAAMSFEPTLEPDAGRQTGQTQAAALAELDASASDDPPELIAAGPAAAQDDDERTQPYADHDTDTAALLRELTSLGMDDDAPAPQTTRPARPTAPRPVPSVAQKKRKGLFGRG